MIDLWLFAGPLGFVLSCFALCYSAGFALFFPVLL